MGLPPIEPPDLRNRRNRPEDDDDNGDEEQQNYPPRDNYRSPPRPRPQQPQRPQQPYDQGGYPPRDQQQYPPPQQQQDYYGDSEEYTRPHTPPQQQGQYPPPQRPRQSGREQYPPPDPYGQDQYPPPDPYGQDAYRPREQRHDEQRSRPRGQRSSDLGPVSSPDLRRRSESSRREGREQDRLGDIDGGLDLRSRSRSSGGGSGAPRESSRGGSTGGGGGTSPGSILLGNNFVSEHQIEAFSLGLVFLMLGVGVLMLIFGLGWFLTQVFPLLSGIILLSTGVYQRIIRGWPVSFFTWFFGATLTAIGLTTLFSDQIEDFGIINAMIAFCGISIIMVAMITLVQVFRRG